MMQTKGEERALWWRRLTPYYVVYYAVIWPSTSVDEYILTFYKIRYILEELYVAVM